MSGEHHSPTIAVNPPDRARAYLARVPAAIAGRRQGGGMVEVKSSGTNPPFAWQDKRVLRKIRDSFDSANTIASALGTYNALTVVASDKQVEEFQTTHAWLAGLSGFSERTVRDRVADLARLGIVAVSTPALRAPSTYRLLPFGDGCLAFGNGCRAFGKREASRLPPLELIELTEGERAERQSLPVELPRNFPATEADAAKQSAFAGCSEDFARQVWNEAAARGGTDFAGNPVVNFRAYLAARAAKERRRQGEANGRGTRPKGSVPDHSKGFFADTDLETKPAPR